MVTTANFFGLRRFAWPPTVLFDDLYPALPPISEPPFRLALADTYKMPFTIALSVGQSTFSSTASN